MRQFGKQALMNRLVAAELESERLRGLLREVTATYRLTNGYHEALLLVPASLWVDVCTTVGVDPHVHPGGGPDSAIGEVAEEPAAAGDAPPIRDGATSAQLRLSWWRWEARRRGRST